VIGENVQWDASFLESDKRFVFNSVDELIEELTLKSKRNDHILIMSNGGFEDIHNRLLNNLK